MPTDPARIKRADPGDPTLCPVWQLHGVYSDESVKKWVMDGCRSASIGCLDCKQPLIDSIKKELQPIQTLIQEYDADLGMVKRIVAEGSEQAREEAVRTMTDIRSAMSLDY